MAVDNRIIERADKLIEVYLDWILSTDLEAGWHQPSMLQRAAEFGGDIPPPTGNDQADTKMITEVGFLRSPHALLPEAKELVGRLKPKYRLPLLVDCRYSGTVDPVTGKRWTARRLAEQMHLRIDQYRERVKFGRRCIIQMLDRQLDLEEERRKEPLYPNASIAS